MTSISYICSLTCDCQRLQYHHIHKSSSHLCIWTALCLLKTLQSLCLLYWQKSKSPLHAAPKFVKEFSNCSFLPMQLLEGTTSLAKRAVLCLFLMSLPALRHERHWAERADKAVPHQPPSNKVPWVVPVPFSVSTTHRKVCLTRVTLKACRNLAAILGKTSKLFYPEAFTGDGHFAEGSLAPESGVGDAQHLQHCYSNSESVENDVQGLFFSWRLLKQFPALIWLGKWTSAFADLVFFVNPFLCAATNLYPKIESFPWEIFKVNN